MIRHSHRLILPALVVCLSLFSTSTTFAQPGRGVPMSIQGSMLPNIVAFDEQGERFSTASLRGSYTVLVFGCLT